MRRSEHNVSKTMTLSEESSQRAARFLPKDLRHSLDTKVNLSKHLEKKSLTGKSWYLSSPNDISWFNLDKNEFQNLAEILIPKPDSEKEMKQVR